MELGVEDTGALVVVVVDTHMSWSVGGGSVGYGTVCG